VDVLFLLLPVALGFVLAAVVVFAWAVRDGQFDDLETPALRVLLDDSEEARP
jgi:cbb3-type cytochrome oxidase maturation protein